MNNNNNKDQTKYVPCKNKKLDPESLKSFTQEELIEKILSLQAHNEQLKNIIMRNNATKAVSEKKGKKDFDFSKCKTQHILLKVMYLGWDYQGYAVQEDSSATIEHHLINALIKCKLIEARETSNYHRCGRTDKGVSSFGQVISITVRAAEESKPPLEYCKMLNRLLPEDIRVLAWQPVDEDISARFSCKSRTYKYFFPKADLNIEAMNEGAQNLIGSFDFRNLCKMDVGNGVTNFVRRIDQASVTLMSECENTGSGYEMCVFTVESQGFLWHQVRCIIAVLLLIGKNLEKPSIIKELLDTEKNPRKPQYPLASDIGLNLFETKFDYDKWIIDEADIKCVIGTLQKIWTSNAIKACHLKSCISELEKLISDPVLQQDSVLLKQESKIYKPLLERNLCSSLEERIDHFVKRRRIQKEETSLC